MVPKKTGPGTGDWWGEVKRGMGICFMPRPILTCEEADLTKQAGNNKFHA